MGAKTQQPASPELPPEEEVLNELQRVLSSESFRRSEQLSGFLRYVVEESLGGRADRIKERNIAVECLSRPDFDARLDSIVRVTANRLRRALQNYYESDGANNPVQISLPRGAYVPVFQTACAVETTENPALDAGLQTRQVPSRSRLAGTGWVLFLAAVVISVGFSLWRSDDSVAPQAGNPTSADIEQAGALPYRVRDGVVEVLIVRTRRDSHWTVPKATWRGETTQAELAAAEAFDEAGVRGSARATAIGDYFYDRNGRQYRVSVHPVLVEEELSSWPQSFRRRNWCDIDTAARLVESERLSTIIAGFKPEGE